VKHFSETPLTKGVGCIFGNLIERMMDASKFRIEEILKQAPENIIWAGVCKNNICLIQAHLELEEMQKISIQDYCSKFELKCVFKLLPVLKDTDELPSSYKSTKEELLFSRELWKSPEIQGASKELFKKYSQLLGFTFKQFGPGDLRVVLTVRTKDYVLVDEVEYPKTVKGLRVVLEEGLFDYATTSNNNHYAH
jgi:hypothetical protein